MKSFIILAFSMLSSVAMAQPMLSGLPDPKLPCQISSRCKSNLMDQALVRIHDAGTVAKTAAQLLQPFKAECSLPSISMDVSTFARVHRTGINHYKYAYACWSEKHSSIILEIILSINLDNYDKPDIESLKLSVD